MITKTEIRIGSEQGMMTVNGKGFRMKITTRASATATRKTINISLAHHFRLSRLIFIVPRFKVEFPAKSVHGDTSRKGNLCTLRRAEGVSRASERSEGTLGYPFIGVPGVIAGEIDVLPAKRRDVLEQGRIELP